MPTPITAGIYTHIFWCLVLGVHHVYGNVCCSPDARRECILVDTFLCKAGQTSNQPLPAYRPGFANVHLCAIACDMKHQANLHSKFDGTHLLA